MKISAIKADLAKSAAGIWIDGIPEMSDLRLKVRPIGNADYRRLYGLLADATPRAGKRGGVIDHAVREEISARCLADTVLLDWDGLEDDAGKPLVYSHDVAKKMLLDPELIAFRDAVSWAANVAQEETIGEAKAKAGN